MQSNTDIDIFKLTRFTNTNNSSCFDYYKDEIENLFDEEDINENIDDIDDTDNEINKKVSTVEYSEDSDDVIISSQINNIIDSSSSVYFF